MSSVQKSFNWYILSAEDIPENQRLITYLLYKVGAKVEVAENGQRAVDLVLAAMRSGNPFDAVLMDMLMPMMDGFEATQKLRSGGYSGPIIAVTAPTSTGDRQKCLDCGCNDWLTKPIDPKRLIALLELWLPRETSPVT